MTLIEAALARRAREREAEPYVNPEQRYQRALDMAAADGPVRAAGRQQPPLCRMAAVATVRWQSAPTNA